METQFNTSEDERYPATSGYRRPNRLAALSVFGGSLTESACGAGAVVLAIIGLADVATRWMIPISAIVIGAGLLARGGATAAEGKELQEEVPGANAGRSVFWGGLSAEALGGVAGVVLGIIALFNLMPNTLMAIGAIVFGGTLLLASGVSAELGRVPVPADPTFRAATRESAYGASALEALGGCAAIVLGIIALTQAAPGMNLVLVSFLIVGAAIMLAAGATGARVVPEVRTHH